ncbi:MAG: hypothetical protein WA113_07240 [Desulfitobacteriaceae bacterium]
MFATFYAIPGKVASVHPPLIAFQHLALRHLALHGGVLTSNILVRVMAVF